MHYVVVVIVVAVAAEKDHIQYGYIIISRTETSIKVGEAVRSFPVGKASARPPAQTYHFLSTSTARETH